MEAAATSRLAALGSVAATDIVGVPARGMNELTRVGDPMDPCGADRQPDWASTTITSLNVMPSTCHAKHPGFMTQVAPVASRYPSVPLIVGPAGTNIMLVLGSWAKPIGPGPSMRCARTRNGP